MCAAVSHRPLPSSTVHRSANLESDGKYRSLVYCREKYCRLTEKVQLIMGGYGGAWPFKGFRERAIFDS